MRQRDQNSRDKLGQWGQVNMADTTAMTAKDTPRPKTARYREKKMG